MVGLPGGAVGPSPADCVVFPVKATPPLVPGRQDCWTGGVIAADGRRDEGGADDNADGDRLPHHGVALART